MLSAATSPGTSSAGAETCRPGLLHLSLRGRGFEETLTIFIFFRADSPSYMYPNGISRLEARRAAVRATGHDSSIPSPAPRTMAERLSAATSSPLRVNIPTVRTAYPETPDKSNATSTVPFWPGRTSRGLSVALMQLHPGTGEARLTVEEPLLRKRNEWRRGPCADSTAPKSHSVESNTIEISPP